MSIDSPPSGSIEWVLTAPDGATARASGHTAYEAWGRSKLNHLAFGTVQVVGSVIPQPVVITELSEFKTYLRKVRASEMRPYQPGELLIDIIVAPDYQPKLGDFIARNPTNHLDQWLVTAAYFAANFETAAV